MHVPLRYGRSRTRALFALAIGLSAVACGEDAPEPAVSEPLAEVSVERATDPEPEPTPPPEATPDEGEARDAPAASPEARAMHDTLLRAARGDTSAAASGFDVGQLEWVADVDPPLYASEDDVPEDGDASVCVCLPEAHRCDLLQPGGVTTVRFTEAPYRITRVESEEP
ncbi:MAG: hypothetical protein AB7S26_18680 [Sandaracinaceae bacterium]